MNQVEQLFTLAVQIQDRYRETEDFKREYMSLKEALTLAAQIMGQGVESGVESSSSFQKTEWTLDELQVAVMQLSDRPYKVLSGNGWASTEGKFSLGEDGLRGLHLTSATAEEILYYVKVNP